MKFESKYNIGDEISYKNPWHPAGEVTGRIDGVFFGKNVISYRTNRNSWVGEDKITHVNGEPVYD